MKKKVFREKIVSQKKELTNILNKTISDSTKLDQTPKKKNTNKKRNTTPKTTKKENK